MSKLLFSLALLAAMLLPTAQAQGAHTVTVEIEDLPAAASSNGTQLSIPFQVHATVSGASPCLSQNAQYTIELTATVENSTGNHTTANVHPRQHTVAGPVLLPSVPGASAERTFPATLIVDAGPYIGNALNSTVIVTATFTGGNGGCPGVPTAAASSDEATLSANFEPAVGFGSTLQGGNEMPGLGLALLLVALAVAGFAVRRQA